MKRWKKKKKRHVQLSLETAERLCVVDNERKVHWQVIGCSEMLEINFQACFSSY